MSFQRFRPIFSLSWQSAAYGIGILGKQALVYLALPIFTQHMPQEEFGVVAVLASILAFTNTVANAGISAATFRIYNDTQDTEARRETLGAAQALVGIYAVIITLVINIFAEYLSEWLLGTPDYSNLLRIVSILLLIDRYIAFGGIILRINVRPLSNSLQGLFQIASQLGISIILVLKVDLGARGYWLGQLGGSLLGFLLMLWLVRKDLVLKISRRYFRELVSFGLPLLPSTLSLWALRLVDRSIITNLVGLSDVAVYEIGYKVGVLTGLIILPFSVAWPQFAYDAMHKSSAKETYRDVLTFVATGVSFIALVVFAFDSQLVRILSTDAYMDATKVIPWVAFSQVAWGVYPILNFGLMISKRTGLIAVVTMASALLNVVLNIVLIPVIGIQGAAIATFVGYLALAVGSYLIGQRFYSYPLDFSRLSRLLIVVLAIVFFIPMIDRMGLNLFAELVMRAGVFVLFPMLLLLTGFISWSQLVSFHDAGLKALRDRLRITPNQG